MSDSYLNLEVKPSMLHDLAMLMNIFLVAAGGATGSVLRYGAGVMATKMTEGNFPWGTLSVNLLGCLLIGIITGLLSFVTNWSQEMRLLLVVGVLGGFTTFSAFSLDSLLLLEKGQTGPAILYIFGSVIGGLAATFVGMWMIRTISP